MIKLYKIELISSKINFKQRPSDLKKIYNGSSTCILDKIIITI